MSPAGYIGIIVAVIIVGIVIYAIVRNKKKKSFKIKVEVPEKIEPGYTTKTISLTSAKREDGSNQFGYETDEEFKARVSKLTEKQFIKLETNDKPFTAYDWEALYSQKGQIGVEARNEVELGSIFAYDYEGNIVQANVDLLTRTFTVKATK